MAQDMSTNSDPYLRNRLAKAIEAQLQKLPKKDAKESFAKLSQAYRSHNAERISASANHNLFISYLAGRMLSTFAVVEGVLNELIELGVQDLKSLVDLGAGPGTVAFAAADIFELETVHLFEKEQSFQSLAMELSQAAAVDVVRNANWHMEDLKRRSVFPSADLLTASYSLGELEQGDALKVADGAFAAAQRALVIIEPGTPKGFELVRIIREHLLTKGAYVAAPCPHQKACPMQGKDFCHFSKRLIREDFHRSIKGASLPYEDEKYAYVIFTKQPALSYEGRLIKKPLLRPGHVTLDICTDGRIERRVVSRSQKDIYKTTRKLEWGDRIAK
jgi:ribosomal protein RSM22 (predicted rRNA methylase)